MIVILLTNACLLTVNETNEIINPGAILIKGSKISDLGDSGKLINKYPGEKALDCHGKLIIPGFVNVHYHGALTIVRGVGPDLGVPPLYSRNIPQGVLLSREETYTMALLGYAEALRSGSTCIAANYLYMDDQVRAIANLGLRAVVSERLHDIDFFRIGQGEYIHDEQAGETSLERNLRLLSDWNGKEEGRITCHLGPHAPDTCTTPFLEKIIDIASRAHVGMTTHMAQSTMENREIYRREGLSPVKFSKAIGLLKSGTVAAHCIHVDDEDLTELADSGASVAFVSEGNLKRGDIAPVSSMENDGINVALCTDAMTGSMIEAMRFGSIVHKLSSGDNTRPTPEHLLRMATINGAKALSLDHVVGSLEKGKKADLLAISTDQYHLAPVISPAGTLVHAAVGTDISDVWIDGRHLVKEGEIVGLDEKKICSEAQKIALKCWQRVHK
ncbi:amidohydrolase family protein [Sporolactobacillus sp. Y61]|uniref:Amidohydrolase family protein n=1 Tax=Sporolactobacillus sp. Y61 TaxID=3160863 RepID=A0AAU8IHF8_9BACL